MKKILILSKTDPNSNPRQNRMINWLKDHYEVEVVGLNKLRVEGIKSHAIESFPRARSIRDLFILLRRIILRNFNLLTGNYEEVNWSRLGSARNLVDELAGKNYDLIISHDLVLLPLVFMIKGKATRAMLDAREYYPMNFNDQWLWRIQRKPVNEYLCREYLPRCDMIITVSDGLASEYRRVYGVQAEVIMSLPASRDMQPSPPQSDRIRIIHHGVAGRSRKTERMIEIMDYVDDRFSLDLMLVWHNRRYYKKLVSMAEKRKNVRVIPPVPMQEIVRTINQYDIGLFLVPPTNFNLEFTLPNKLFEFIQARLAVAIGPSIEMRKIVEKYDCGIVSKDFSSLSLARELNRLTPEKLMQLKENSHKAAQELNAEANAKRVMQIVQDLTEISQ
ncbi:MAG: capsular biosynthesis protein [Chloroflexi bacterium]|nr:capsular biosynthesis protein [Chloroflexota bacterium]